MVRGVRVEVKLAERHLAEAKHRSAMNKAPLYNQYRNAALLVPKCFSVLVPQNYYFTTFLPFTTYTPLPRLLMSVPTYLPSIV